LIGTAIPQKNSSSTTAKDVVNGNRIAITMTTPEATFLHNSCLKLLLFGGKGGVGKTTVAAATALYHASREPGKRVVLISTDPAHSLSDSLDQPIGDKITPIATCPNLLALEMDAGRLLAEFRERHAAALKTIAYRGTLFDHDDIAAFLDLSLPGLDELMAIIEVADITRSQRYDLVILDTAPTGHTLRLLALPDLLQDWLRVLDLMLAKHRYMVSTFGRYRPDETDAFLSGMSAKLAGLRTLLSASDITEFVPVVIPEAMSIAETARLAASLKALGVRTRHLVVNRVERPRDCPFCSGRRQGQEIYLEEIEARFADWTPLWAPHLPHEVRGPEALQEYLEALEGSAGELRRGAAHRDVPGASRMVPVEASLGRDVSPRPFTRDVTQKQLLLFGGKGGTGKTTVAAATALYLSQQHAGERTLLFSTDPAHSLADSLDQPIGDQITPITGAPGLFALEMDASTLLEELNREYRLEIQEVFDSFLSSSFDAPFDRQVMQELVSLVPTGIDELMALIKIMDLMDRGAFDRYVLDLAPTGHALRFLEMPGLARTWFITFSRLLLKYQGLGSLMRTAEWIRGKSKQLRRVEQLLGDEARCQLVAVAIPEAMAVLETERLVQRLQTLSVSCRWIVVNMVMPPSLCPFCAAVHEQQRGRITRLSDLASRRAGLGGLVPLSLFPHEIRTVDGLTDVAQALYRGS
jgi:arsenite-transporting ATPase